MIDYHIHIGQFNEKYFDAFDVFEAIEEAGNEYGIDQIWYSSTSSCREDVELSKIEEEIAYAQKFKSDTLIVKPYLWFTTNYSKQGITIKSATQTFDYCGIKLHPSAHCWNLDDSHHKRSLLEIFEWSSDSQKPILIHSGISKECLPNRFEEFFRNFPKANIILAHSNPIDMTISLLKEYKNLKCDIAYSRIENINKLLCVFPLSENRILFGSDFPITNYFSSHLLKYNFSLKEQYKKDCGTSCLLKPKIFNNY